MKLSDAVKLMRPKHYIKNFLLFVSIVFDKALFQPEVLVKVLGGFAAFSLLSSVVYIINDINDAEEDQRHPIKKNRPIASGAVRSGQAIALAVVLAVCSLALYAGVCGFRWSSFLFLLLYFLVNLGYSLGLKNVTFLDVVLLQAVLFITVSALPLPGTVGVGESGFLLLYKTLFPGAYLGSGMLLSRGINLYLYVIVTGLFLLLYCVVQKRRCVVE